MTSPPWRLQEMIAGFSAKGRPPSRAYSINPTDIVVRVSRKCSRVKDFRLMVHDPIAYQSGKQRKHSSFDSHEHWVLCCLGIGEVFTNKSGSKNDTSRCARTLKLLTVSEVVPLPKTGSEPSEYDVVQRTLLWASHNICDALFCCFSPRLQGDFHMKFERWYIPMPKKEERKWSAPSLCTNQ